MAVKSTNPVLCNNCGAIVSGDVCLRCGNIADADNIKPEEPKIADETTVAVVDESNNQPEQFNNIIDPLPTLSVDVPVDHAKSESHQNEAVASIFEKITPDTFKTSEVEKPRAFHKQILIVFLVLILLGLFGYSYWIFNQSAKDFIDPIPGLASSAVQNSDGTNAPSLSDKGKIIDVNIGLKEGNFAKYNFAQFADASNNLFVQMFGVKDFVNNFISKDLLAVVLKDYKLKDDDVDVYFSDKFALLYPKDATDTWGFVVSVKDKDFVSAKLKTFDANKLAAEKAAKLKKPAAAKSKTAAYSIDYTKVSARLVEVAVKDSGKEYYLLISNSNEFLDHMKELSEGTVPNLSGSAVYAQAQKDLPNVGQVFIYKPAGGKSWDSFSDWVASHYSYTGLDKILKSLKSSLVIFYTKDGKLKIDELSDF